MCYWMAKGIVELLISECVGKESQMITSKFHTLYSEFYGLINPYFKIVF